MTDGYDMEATLRRRNSELKEAKTEIERLRALTEEQNGGMAIMRGVLERQRAAVIEECAKVAETSTADASYPLTSEIGRQIAAAIRATAIQALKEKP